MQKPHVKTSYCLRTTRHIRKEILNMNKQLANNQTSLLLYAWRPKSNIEDRHKSWQDISSWNIWNSMREHCWQVHLAVRVSNIVRCCCWARLRHMRVDRFRSIIKLQLQSMIAHNLLVFRFQEVKSILSTIYTYEIFRVSSNT